MSDTHASSAGAVRRMMRRHTALFHFTLACMTGFGAWALLRGRDD